MKKASKRWFEQAEYDLDTALAMLESGRYLYVLFCCQQAIEKGLKAVIVEQTGNFPPTATQSIAFSPDRDPRTRRRSCRVSW